jgi:predicted NAD/FAD-binding protein
MKIAIIGGGVSGVSSALLLQEKHEITLFEKNNYVGGHTNTILVEDEPGKKVAVDTGFIVCNDWTYPNLHKMFKKTKSSSARY